MIKKIFPVLLIFLLLFVFWQMRDQTNTAPEHSEPRVAVTLFPLYDIVKNIAGDAIGVDLILEPGASPHTFEPTPQIIRKTQEAKMVFAIGHGLDDWALNLVADPLVVDVVDDNIILRETTEPSIEEHEEGEEEEHGPVDPHYWLTAQNAMIISQTVAESLKKTFPESRNIFEENLARYLVELEELDTEIKNQLAPIKQKQLITFHDAWYYFADAYGLTIIGTFEPTVGREPTPKYLSKLSELIDMSGVRVLYAEPQFASTGLHAFLSDQDITIATIDPEGSKFSTSYIDLMRQNASTIAQNQ